MKKAGLSLKEIVEMGYSVSDEPQDVLLMFVLSQTFFFLPDTYFALLCCCFVKEQTSYFKTQGEEMVETEA